nr:YetF domain-containing protein [Thalassobacillus devorans]
MLLRVAGRKSISQMTLAQVVIMIGIGSWLVQPIVGKNIWTTLIVGLTLVLTLLVMEYVQVKANPLEKFITGSSKVVIENGELQVDRLKKLRFTVDQLEMKLRQNSVTNINDVAYATIEPNGQLGFELKQQKQPATKEDVNNLRLELMALKQQLSQLGTQSPNIANYSAPAMQKDIFSEVSQQGHTEDPPQQLQ